MGYSNKDNVKAAVKVFTMIISIEQIMCEILLGLNTLVNELFNFLS